VDPPLSLLPVTNNIPVRVPNERGVWATGRGSCKFGKLCLFSFFFLSFFVLLCLFILHIGLTALFDVTVLPWSARIGGETPGSLAPVWVPAVVVL